MITMQQLGTYISAEPFRPFRIKMTSGQSFMIRHPEMIAVGRSTAHVFTSMSEDPEEAKVREHEISLLLIESIEPLAKAKLRSKKT